MDNYDKQILKTLIAAYKSIDSNIQSLGEDALAKYDPKILEKNEALREYIVNYAQRFTQDLSYDHLEIDEIEEYIDQNIPKI